LKTGSKIYLKYRLLGQIGQQITEGELLEKKGRLLVELKERGYEVAESYRNISKLPHGLLVVGPADVGQEKITTDFSEILETIGWKDLFSLVDVFQS
jgi:hypothetical protein